MAQRGNYRWADISEIPLVDSTARETLRRSKRGRAKGDRLADTPSVNPRGGLEGSLVRVNPVGETVLLPRPRVQGEPEPLTRASHLHPALGPGLAPIADVYIYIYICVCVCVYRTSRRHPSAPDSRLLLESQMVRMV